MSKPEVTDIKQTGFPTFFQEISSCGKQCLRNAVTWNIQGLRQKKIVWNRTLHPTPRPFKSSKSISLKVTWHCSVVSSDLL